MFLLGLSSRYLRYKRIIHGTVLTFLLLIFSVHMHTIHMQCLVLDSVLDMQSKILPYVGLHLSTTEAQQLKYDFTVLIHCVLSSVAQNTGILHIIHQPIHIICINNLTYVWDKFLSASLNKMPCIRRNWCKLEIICSKAQGSYHLFDGEKSHP